METVLPARQYLSPANMDFGRRELTTIAESLKDAYSWERVSIQTNGTCSLDASLIQKICDFIVYWIPWLTPYLVSSPDTAGGLQFFKDIFGEDRLQRISMRYNLHLREKEQANLPLTRWDVLNIFIGSADIRREDIEEAGGGTLEEFAKQRIDAIYKLLIPFSHIENIFLNNAPVVDGYSSSRRDDFEGRKNRVFLIEEMRRNWERFYALDGIPEASFQIRLGKRILHDTLPVGVVIPHRDGYFVNQSHVVAGGAFAVLLKCVNKTDTLRSMIVFLSTRTEFNSTSHVHSMFEIVHRNIGSEGVKKIYSRLQEELIEEGSQFLTSENEKVDLMGISLGGAQAERLTCLFLRDYPDCVRNVTLVSGAGLDDPTLTWFKEHVENFLKGAIVWRLALKYAISYGLTTPFPTQEMAT